MRYVVLSSVVFMVLASCSSTGHAPTRPGVINHVVFIKLIDRGDKDLLVMECDRDIASIPGVVSYWCGRHGEFGRDMVDDEYDIGLYVGFNSSSDYTAYVEHPNHVGLVNKWKPRFEWIRVHDIVDESP
jgi:hypothetical protein